MQEQPSEAAGGVVAVFEDLLVERAGDGPSGPNYDPDMLAAGYAVVDYVQALEQIATGQITHTRQGACPDEVAGANSRDSNCPACQVLIRAREAQQ